MKVAPSFYPGDEQEGSTEPQEPHKLFDVTRTVASVYAGGSENARIMAFRIIGMEETDGEYSFPGEDGRKITVTVSTEERSH